jgi:hypothetical protein
MSTSIISKRSPQKAFVSDRKPTIYELARPQFMGLRDQRPAEMLKNELQTLPFTRKGFYNKPLNLPLLNHNLKMKYSKMRNFNNVSTLEAKREAFTGRHVRASSQLDHQNIEKLINHNVNRKIFRDCQTFKSGGRLSPIIKN